MKDIKIKTFAEACCNCNYCTRVYNGSRAWWCCGRDDYYLVNPLNTGCDLWIKADWSK